MKVFISIILLLAGCLSAFGQNDLQELVKTERDFARMASEKGTRTAFLQYLAPDSVVFDPERANGIEVWTARKPGPSLLTWYPEFADVSSSGKLGYTTGPWEFRAKGRDDVPAAYGHFVTIWQRQASGEFKAALDIGVDHPKAERAETELLVGPTSAGSAENSSYAGDTAAKFFETVTREGMVRAYREFAADDIRILRDGKLPVIGKKDALKEIGRSKAKLTISKRMSFFGSGDLAYATNTYSLVNADGSSEKGNFVQIWKFRNNGWKIVMDVFTAVQK